MIYRFTFENKSSTCIKFYLKSATVPITVQNECNEEQTPFFDFATEDFPVVLLRGGKGLPQQGYESVKAETEENIRSISNQVNDGVGIVGDRNIGLNIVGGNNTFGNISSSEICYILRRNPTKLEG